MDSVSTNPDSLDELEDIYQRCDVSNNGTDNPMSFDDFKQAIQAHQLKQQAPPDLNRALFPERYPKYADEPATVEGIDELVRDIMQVPYSKSKAKAAIQAREQRLLEEADRRTMAVVDDYIQRLKDVTRNYTKQYPDANVNDFIGLIVGTKAALTPITHPERT